MSADMREEIERILAQGFPARPEVDVPFDFDSDADKAWILSEEFPSAFAENMANLAIHVNDKRHRDFMRYQVANNLLFGRPLHAAEIAWLIYLLERIEDAPCECNNGRPIDGNGEALNRLALVAFIIDDEIKNPVNRRGSVTDRLKRAAGALCKSYEAVRKTYYSKSFKPLLQRMKERRFNPLGDK